MTKIKNTKKGMAKKTLSMSLVVAMLATSNVPVWAAEFSDGTDAAVATEAPAAETFSDETAEAPVVEDTTADVSPASTIVNEGNMSIDLSTEESSVVWGASSDKITVKGTVNKDGAAATSWKYRWVDENGIAVTNNTITVSKYKDMNAAVAAMSLDVSGSTYAGKTLTLYIYDENPASQTLYDIKTGVTITVEKQNLKDVAEIKGVTDLKYNGFARSFNTESVSVEKKSDSSTIDSKYYALTSTSATNAGDETIVTASADDVADSPYKGSISVTKKIVAKTYNKDDKGNDSVDIIANVNKGLSFPYTGKTVHLSKDNVTVAESKSKNNGDDGKLSGADLSGAFKDATVTGTKAGASYPVSVTLDGSKLTNFANESGNALNDTVLANTENTVEITKRDLSAAGTKISVNTASGYVPVTATSASLSANYA